MSALPFRIVDVFAERPYEGNQLGVFRNAARLSAEQMLRALTNYLGPHTVNALARFPAAARNFR